MDKEDCHVRTEITVEKICQKPLDSSSQNDTTCAICLGAPPQNQCFTDTCLHAFCFICLLEWSKVKAVCPLCQKPFRTILHNVVSDGVYDEYYVHHHRIPNIRLSPSSASLVSSAQRIASSTSSWSSEPLNVVPSTSAERRSLYELGLRVKPNVQERYRDTSAEFYSNNPACTHRLIPWLNRELVALLDPSSATHTVAFCMERILYYLRYMDMTSSLFRRMIRPFLGDFTDQFAHEFYSFASSPYEDMMTYDRRVVYCFTQSSGNAGADSTPESLSGIVGTPPTSSTRATVSTGLATTSGLRDDFRTSDEPRTGDVVDDSTDGGTSSDDFCVIVGVQKPPRERTPVEVIVVSSSEEDEPVEPIAGPSGLQRLRDLESRVGTARSKKETTNSSQSCEERRHSALHYLRTPEHSSKSSKSDDDDSRSNKKTKKKKKSKRKRDERSAKRRKRSGQRCRSPDNNSNETSDLFESSSVRSSSTRSRVCNQLDVDFFRTSSTADEDDNRPKPKVKSAVRLISVGPPDQSSSNNTSSEDESERFRLKSAVTAVQSGNRKRHKKSHRKSRSRHRDN